MSSETYQHLLSILIGWRVVFIEDLYLPVFQKLDPSDKANYRTVSILPLLSKIFKKVMYDQLYDIIEHFLNQLLCGFRKAHSTQHALFRLFQKWQKELDSGVFIGTVLMDLSKAYYCWPHDLLIAKLEAYGLHNGSLNLLLDYLSYRILTVYGFCNFADNNTLHSCRKRLTEIKENIVSDTKSILSWFRLNYLKANPGKFQFMILGDKSHPKRVLKIYSIKVEASDDVLLLGITTDKKLTFKQHVENLCRKPQ